MAHKISESGLAFIKGQEGFLDHVYVCVGGAATIGYGSTNADSDIIGVKIKKGLTCTKAQADKWLRQSIAQKYGPAVDKYDPIYHWTQGEFDALVSFDYNLGKIDTLTAHGTRTRAQIADKLLEYIGAGGNPNDGLKARRKAERKMFLAAASYQGAQRDLPALRSFDSGSAVKAAQALLNASNAAHLFQPLTIDGRFGALTEEAVKAFQEANGLTVDGIIGQQTWEELTA